MATLSNIASMNGAATTHADAEVAEKTAAAPAGTNLPAVGLVLAEAPSAYRTIDHKFLSHTNGVVSSVALAAHLQTPARAFCLLVVGERYRHPPSCNCCHTYCCCAGRQAAGDPQVGAWRQLPAGGRHRDVPA